ncbi:hypothetical protein ACFX12_000070 [Malus domestica]
MSSAPGPDHSSSVRNTTRYYRPTNRADEISPVEFQDRPGSNHESLILKVAHQGLHHLEAKQIREERSPEIIRLNLFMMMTIL